MGRRVFRNYYKGHMDKIKGEGGSRGGREVWLGWGGAEGTKCRQLYLSNKVIKKWVKGPKKHFSKEDIQRI